jgi:exonuclease VII small subunit
MLKNKKNNLTLIRKRYAEYTTTECTPYKDCSAHDAAQSALDTANAELETATTNYKNAVELQNSLKEEQSTATKMMDNYKSVYDVMSSVGPSVANPQNMVGLSGIIDCICNYGSSVEEAYNQAVNEVSRCEQEVIKCQKAVERAKTKLANTPCVWGCR